MKLVVEYLLWIQAALYSVEDRGIDTERDKRFMNEPEGKLDLYSLSTTACP